MKARIPQHREFIINFPDSVDQAKASEGWNKLTQIVEDYKKAHNGASVYAPTFIKRPGGPGTCCSGSPGYFSVCMPAPFGPGFS